MIAVAILAIALVTLIGSQSQSIRIAQLSRFDTTAALLARQKITELVVSGAEELSGENGDFGEDFPDYHWQTAVEDLSGEDIGLEEGDNLIQALDLTISAAADQERTFHVRTLLLVHQGQP